MHDTALWSQLLPRIKAQACLLEQIASLAERHRLGFDGVGSVLLESGFTLPEAQELYGLLQD